MSKGLQIWVRRAQALEWKLKLKSFCHCMHANPNTTKLLILPVISNLAWWVCLGESTLGLNQRLQSPGVMRVWDHTTPCKSEYIWRGNSYLSTVSNISFNVSWIGFSSFDSSSITQDISTDSWESECCNSSSSSTENSLSFLSSNNAKSKPSS